MLNKKMQSSAVQAWDTAVSTDPVQLAHHEFVQFQAMIYRVAGIQLSDAKQALVSGRLANRVRQLGQKSFGSYFQKLLQDSGELQMAVDLLTTNETYFFREPKHFDLLRETILPELRGRANVRIWSGACSSGEEPYTIAMMLSEVLGTRSWEVLASDISTRVLEAARTGLYPMADAEDIPRDYLIKHCLKGVGANAGSFLIAPAIRERVRFQQVNLNAPLPNLGTFDVIFLRNVMIYFDQTTKREVVQRLINALKPGGWLIVGHAESLNGIAGDMRTIRPSVYRKLA